MAKIMATECPDHANCTLRVTVGDGTELIEHIRTLTTTESNAIAGRLDALENAIGRVLALEARQDGLDVEVRAQRADVVDVNQAISTLSITDPRFDALDEAVTGLRAEAARLEAMFRQTVSITDEAAARGAELLADVAESGTAVAGVAAQAQSRIDGLETKVADLKSEFIAHQKAENVN